MSTQNPAYVAPTTSIGRVPYHCGGCGQIVYTVWHVTMQTTAKVAEVKAPWLLPPYTPVKIHDCPARGAA